MGLFSDGGVHSHASHALALVDLAKRHGVDDVQLHLFLDGRDVPPRQALDDLEAFEPKLAELGNARIATVIGRYYAMDRDKRWDRNEKAYRALVLGEGERADSAIEAVKQSYEADVGDEFVKPTVDRRPRRGHDPERRRRHLLQLPRRPRPPAHPRVRRCRTSTASSARTGRTRSTSSRSRSTRAACR